MRSEKDPAAKRRRGSSGRGKDAPAAVTAPTVPGRDTPGAEQVCNTSQSTFGCDGTRSASGHDPASGVSREAVRGTAEAAVPYPLGEIAAPLVGWYRACARTLPWRSEVTPYRVWVSEIMLQQTRVEAVKPYFARFLEAFPSAKELAEAPEDKLLKCWEGLGYYSRVRNMQKAAQKIVSDYGGEMPRTRKELLSLPGIGSYTAGAIAAFAYGLPEPAVDGNVLRVVARLCADDRNILDPRIREDDEEWLRAVIPHDAAGDFGQALIELGALVCLPGSAVKCGECPLAGLCRARAEGLTGILPVRFKEQKRREENRTVLLLCDSDAVLLEKRPAKGLLAGLWQFPNVEGFLTEAEAVKAATALGAEVIGVEPLPDARHVFTHITWHMKGYRLTVRQLTPAMGTAVPLSEVRSGFAIPSAFSAYRKCLPEEK